MKGDFTSCYLLLQPTLRNVSCKKKLTPSEQRYYRSTIKMRGASSPVPAALLIIPSLWRPFKFPLNFGFKSSFGLKPKVRTKL